MTLAVDGLKFCPKCGETKPVEAFHRNKQNSDGRHGWCAKCHNQAGCDWAKRNPRTHNARTKTWRAQPGNMRKASAATVKSYRKRLYGITEEQYAAMLEAQSDVCAICRQPEVKERNGVVFALAVDHCHSTGQVRGLLCAACNAAIGLLKDNPERMKRAAEYVNSYQPDQGGPKRRI